MLDRKVKLEHWLKSELNLSRPILSPVSGDASFRCYYRCYKGAESYIVMDSPPEKENNFAFIEISNLFAQQNIKVPSLICTNTEDGFIVLSDFGDVQLLKILTAENADYWYKKASDLIIKCQSIPLTVKLPRYHQEAILQELSVFKDWILHNLLRFDDLKIQRLTAEADKLLVENMLTQPQVVVHRDFHSRNLMVIDESQLGVLDYQDAVIGPITYDMVSLFRDCYIKWPEAKINDWLQAIYIELSQHGVLPTISFNLFKRWFDLTGLQRHLKCLGIFARLQLRDGKSGYLKDIPRTFNYVTSITGSYPEFANFHEVLLTEILPKLNVSLRQFGIKEVA